MKNTDIAAKNRDFAVGAVLTASRHERKESIVIIPTYNEALNLEALVAQIMEVGAFDVLVVDDNSPDGTGAVAEALARRFRGRITVVHRPGKLGLGTAYVAGFRRALDLGYQWVFTMDADFSHDIQRLPALRAALADADVVIGSRYVSGGGTRHWPRWRRLLSQCGSTYARLILGLPVRDVTGGFKGFRRQVLEALLPELDTMRARGYAFQIEMTYRCATQGFTIVELPILFENRRAGDSKLRGSIVAEALWVVWALRLSRRPPRSHAVTTRRAKAPALALLLVLVAILGALIAQWRALLFPTRATPSSALSLTRPTLPSEPPAMADVLAMQGKTGLPAAALQIQGKDLTPNVPFSFVGAKFLPGETTEVLIANLTTKTTLRLSSLKADRSGGVGMTSQSLLPTLAPGTYTLLVKGARSQRLGTATFHLRMIPPQVTVAAFSVTPRSDDTFSGSGFLPDEAVTVYFGDAHGATLGTGQANHGGNVTGHFTIPQKPAGRYTFAFIGQHSQTPITLGMTILGFHPWVVLDNYVVDPHIRVRFIGNDFAPNETVSVYLNYRRGEPRQRLHADSSGAFSVPATWSDEGLQGPQTLIFVGQQSGAVTTTPFTAAPPQNAAAGGGLGAVALR